MKRALGYTAVILFLVTCIALASNLITPRDPQAAESEPAYSFDSEDELRDYVDKYIEEHYAADQSEIESQFEYLYDAGRSDGRREGYDEGYRDGYKDGYEDGANGEEYWDP